MRRWLLTAALVTFLAGPIPTLRANWFSGVMDPYPCYYHPSYYFPPAMEAFYAGYGYASLIPGSYYSPTPLAAHDTAGTALASAPVVYTPYTITLHKTEWRAEESPDTTQPVALGRSATPRLRPVVVPYQAVIYVPVRR